jgi:Rod binding domain-containing protein
MDSVKTQGAGSAPRQAVHRSGLDDKAKARLEKATREFEAVFLSYMLKTMRGGENEEDGLFGNNFGGDLMTGMFDQELARYVTRGSSLGLGEMMYRSLTGERYRQHERPDKKPEITGSKTPAEVPLVPDRELRDGVPLRMHHQPAAASAPPLSRTQVEPAPQKKSEEVGPAKPAPGGGASIVPDSVQARVEAFHSLIEDAAAQHGVDSSLVRAIIASESGGRPDALSPKSAKGLMQLIDSTAAEMGVQRIWDPAQNISGGVKYLKQQLDRFDGDITLAAAAYNAGPGAVRKHGGVPPYRETQQYVRRVLNYLSYFQGQEVSGDGND